MAWVEASDGDLGFHLATGREILAAGRIPSTNVLSFTQPEHPWLLHQWLPAVLFELLWRSAGWAGLMPLKLAVLGLTWSLAYAGARALGATPLAAATTCVVAAAASAFRFELRPYLFTHLTLAVAVWALCRTVGRRGDGHGSAMGSRAGPGWAAAALAVGCQLHAGAIDVAILLVVFALGTWVEGGRRHPAEPHGLRSSLRFAGAAAAGLGAGAAILALYHPWGARVLLVPFEMATHRYWGEHLVEFRRPWKLPAELLLAYWAWLAVAVVVLLWRAAKIHLGLWLCAAAFAFASLLYVRMAYAFALVSLPLVAAAATEVYARSGRRVRGPLRALAFAALCASAPAYVYRQHAPGTGFAEWTWPSGHFAFIREQQLQGRAFVSDAWAGPFLGAFYPERRAFFDNRLEAYSDRFAREVYQRVRYGDRGWDALLDRHGVEFLVLRYTTPGEARFQAGAPNLRQHLARDPRFALVYFDDLGALFVRRAGPNAGVAATHAIPGVDPDRREFLVRPALAAPSLLAAAQRGNRSLTLVGLSALALADAGDLANAGALAGVLRARAPGDAFTRRVQQRLAAVAQP